MIRRLTILGEETSREGDHNSPLFGGSPAEAKSLASKRIQTKGRRSFLNEQHNLHSLDYLRSRVAILESIVCELLAKNERLRCLYLPESIYGSINPVDFSYTPRDPLGSDDQNAGRDGWQETPLSTELEQHPRPSAKEKYGTFAGNGNRGAHEVS
jgi:hypothetical protein